MDSPLATLGRYFPADDPEFFYIQVGQGYVLVRSPEGLDQDLRPGQSVLWWPDSNEIFPAPDSFLGEVAQVGTIRHLAPGFALVERDLSLISVATDRSDLSLGATISLDQTGSRIDRVISNTSISSRLGAVEGADLAPPQPIESKGLTWNSFGGYADVKRRVRELIELPLLQSEAFAEIGARPVKGVLFAGPPGTGKTHLARIVASEADAAFFEVSGPEVFNMYYGQSEKRIRELFKAAREAGSAIIFFDEIDSIAGIRTGQSHEVSQRVVAQMLTEMDGFTSRDSVVVVAATNRPEEIDPALLRPGRFDWRIDFHLPDEGDRVAVLEAAAASLACAETLPVGEVAARSEGWSSAELAAIFTEAALLAVSDGRRALGVEDLWGGFSRVANSRMSGKVAR